MRLLRDRYVLYTSLLAPVAWVAALGGGDLADVAVAVAVTPPFVLAQATLGIIQRRSPARVESTGWSLLRLLVALAFVGVFVNAIGGETKPLLAMYLPVVVAAAAAGATQAAVIGTLAATIYLMPLLIGVSVPAAFVDRALTHAGVAVLLAFATRQLLASLQRATASLRTAIVTERRRSRQVAAMEQVGRVLVGGGATPELLDRALSEMADRFGYAFVSIYLWSDDVLKLGAQRNYQHAPAEIPPGRGVVGRVALTHAVVHLPEVSAAPDYIPVDTGVVSEICAPLLVDDAFLGVLNVEATRRLDRVDRDLVVTLADRVATVVALGREREALAERGALFRRLHEFTTAVSATLEIDQLASAIVASTDLMVPADLVVVTLLDRAAGQYTIRAGKGADPRTIGRQVRSGEGLAGRAIRDRVTVVDPRYSPQDYPTSVRDLAVVAARIGAAVPLIRDGVVIGAITVGRADHEAQFSPIEIEALELLAGHASLAVANAFLHAEMATLAVHDPLTGLYNRRHFDEALERLVAAHRRGRLGTTKPVAAVMFDLDRFGQFNKDHGHQVGDAVLRAFAGILRKRFRRSDLVARYGGEEFVAVLEGATLDDAQAVAEGVRIALARATVPDERGTKLSVTVSAGCAALDEAEPSGEALLRTADVALFMAKRAGRDRVVAA